MYAIIKWPHMLRAYRVRVNPKWPHVLCAYVARTVFPATLIHRLFGLHFATTSWEFMKLLQLHLDVCECGFIWLLFQEWLPPCLVDEDHCFTAVVQNLGTIKVVAHSSLSSVIVSSGVFNYDKFYLI